MAMVGDSSLCFVSVCPSVSVFFHLKNRESKQFHLISQLHVTSVAMMFGEISVTVDDDGLL